jgi:glycosidase
MLMDFSCQLNRIKNVGNYDAVTARLRLKPNISEKRGVSMKKLPGSPIIYEINTWVWLNDLRRERGTTVALGNVPPRELRRIAASGFDAVWLMGIWQRSPAATQIAREHPGLQTEYSKVLPDYTEKDVVGSPYSIYRYEVDPELGGEEGLAELRERLHGFGLRLILDFVPNHLAPDHAWVMEHPEYLVRGSATDLRDQPGKYFSRETPSGQRVFGHGRASDFEIWTDTVQLDYRRAETRRAMTDLLQEVAARCDGVRCDMAMLPMRDVFLRTWGGEFDSPSAEFWSSAIAEVKAAYPDLLFIAEVYGDLQYALQQQGFDYAYDKRLYDRLLGGDITAVRDHLRFANQDFQRRLVRFVENHDEQRARSCLGGERSRACAALALTLPGARLVYEGQMEGWMVKLPVQLGRRRPEAPDQALMSFYRGLLAILHTSAVFHDGDWRWLEPRESRDGDSGHNNVIAYRWQLGKEYRVVAVNMAATPAQCHIPLDVPSLENRVWHFTDDLNGVEHVRTGKDLLFRGLYLDLPAYGFRLFKIEPEYERVIALDQVRKTEFAEPQWRNI